MNNSDNEEVFGWLIDEFEVKKDVFLRYIIFVEFIIDVFKIYLICWKWIGIDKSEIYEMFYSKIVEGKKEYIRFDMIKEGNIWILICMNLVGMGVNFYGVYNVIYYGFLREMDILV